VAEPDTTALERLLAEHGKDLMRAALALTGNRPEGEDLLQAALERLLRNWRTVTDPESYLRRTLYNLAADNWRRRSRWRSKLPLVRDRYQVAPVDATATVDQRDVLIRALGQLPPQQRAVVVLRYWEQLSEAQTAELLGCSEGAVKSAASRGLQRLRDLAGVWQDTGTGRRTGTAAGARGSAGARESAAARRHTTVEIREGTQ
jgi:RNA polymerase sigma-70 factor (sigma-E family)